MAKKQVKQALRRIAPHAGDCFIISRGKQRQVVLHPPDTKPEDVSVAVRLLPGDIITLEVSKKIRNLLGLQEKEVGVYEHDGQSMVALRSQKQALPLYTFAGRGVKLHIGELAGAT